MGRRASRRRSGASAPLSSPDRSARTRGCWSSACSRFSVPSLSANPMRELLESYRYNDWILLALLAIPTVAALGIWVHGAMLGDEDAVRDRGGRTARMIAFIALVVEFVLSIGLWWTMDQGTAAMQAVFEREWIPSWGTSFSLGIDGIALMMVLLTTFLMPITILGSWTGIRIKRHSYYALLLILTTGMLGVFMARDLFLFYVMWEIMLVPMYFIIGIWGGERRISASLKFFIYTMVGSLLMLVAIVYLGLKAGGGGTPNFAYDAVQQLSSTSPWGATVIFGLAIPTDRKSTRLNSSHL